MPRDLDGVGSGGGPVGLGVALWRLGLRGRFLEGKERLQVGGLGRGGAARFAELAAEHGLVGIAQARGTPKSAQVIVQSPANRFRERVVPGVPFEQFGFAFGQAYRHFDIARRGGLGSPWWTWWTWWTWRHSEHLQGVGARQGWGRTPPKHTGDVVGHQ